MGSFALTNNRSGHAMLAQDRVSVKVKRKEETDQPAGTNASYAQLAEALHQTRTQLQQAERVARLGFVEMELDMHRAYWSDGVYRILGLEPQAVEPSLDQYLAFVHPDDRSLVRQTLEQAVREAQPVEMEHRLMLPDGALRYVRGCVEITRDASGNPLRLVGTLFDITERKQAEEALAFQTVRLNTLCDISQAVLAAQSPQEIANVALERLFDLVEYTWAGLVEIEVASDQAHLLAVRGRVPNAVNAGLRVALKHQAPCCQMLVDMHEPYQVRVSELLAVLPEYPQLSVIQAEGMRWTLLIPLVVGNETIGVLTLWSDREAPFPEGALTIGREVAGPLSLALHNARLCERARQDAESKDRQLREVNHRVNNTLMSIVALLSAEQRHLAQSQRSADPTCLQGMIARVNGLAALHRLLSETQWEPMLLSQLAEHLIYVAMPYLPADTRLNMRVPESAVMVTANQAHSLALIINELVANTFEHALQERKMVSIQVHIAHDERSGAIAIEYRDDGPGYPPEVTRLERYNVGLELIQNLVRTNLRGDLQLCNDGGAVTLIRFPAQS